MSSTNLAVVHGVIMPEVFGRSASSLEGGSKEVSREPSRDVSPVETPRRTRSTVTRAPSQHSVRGVGRSFVASKAGSIRRHMTIETTDSQMFPKASNMGSSANFSATAPPPPPDSLFGNAWRWFCLLSVLSAVVLVTLFFVVFTSVDAVVSSATCPGCRQLHATMPWWNLDNGIPFVVTEAQSAFTGAVATSFALGSNASGASRLAGVPQSPTLLTFDAPTVPPIDLCVIMAEASFGILSQAIRAIAVSIAYSGPQSNLPQAAAACVKSTVPSTAVAWRWFNSSVAVDANTTVVLSVYAAAPLLSNDLGQSYLGTTVPTIITDDASQIILIAAIIVAILVLGLSAAMLLSFWISSDLVIAGFAFQNFATLSNISHGYKEISEKYRLSRRGGGRSCSALEDELMGPTLLLGEKLVGYSAFMPKLPSLLHFGPLHIGEERRSFEASSSVGSKELAAVPDSSEKLNLNEYEDLVNLDVEVMKKSHEVSPKSDDGVGQLQRTSQQTASFLLRQSLVGGWGSFSKKDAFAMDAAPWSPVMSPSNNPLVGPPQLHQPPNRSPRASVQASSLLVPGNTAAAAAPSVGIDANRLIKRVTFVVCRFSLAPRPFDVNAKALLAVSQKFHSIVCQTATEFSGEVMYRSLTEITVCWNAFKPYPFHEVRGCLAALHIASNMSHSFEDDPDVQIVGAKWGLCVNSGASVISIIGSAQRMTPAVTGEALVVAQKAVRLTSILHSNALVMEPCYAVARGQVFCLPVDVIGQPDSAQLLVLELKGTVDEFKLTDYAQLAEGFSCMCFHKFEQAELLLSQCEGLDHTAARLLQLVRLFIQVKCQLGDQALPMPYCRQMPVWDSHETLADQYELDHSVADALADVHVRMPAAQFRRMRLPSLQPDMFLRNEIEREKEGPDTEEVEEDSFSGANHRPSITNTVEGNSTPPSPSMQRPHVNNSDSSVVIESLSEFKDHRGVAWRRSERELGRGSFGTVCLGMAEEGSLVAMKLLPMTTPSGSVTSPTTQSQDNSRGNQMVDEVLKEVALLSQFQSEYVVKYLSCAFVQRNIIVIMEFVGGGSLSRIVNIFGALPLPIVRRFAKDIVTGLAFLHEKKVVHRDINPNNVLLTIDGLCKLSDFGASTTSIRQQQGFGGGVHGTPIFMAPEACRGAATNASDVWSFGVLLCFMIQGGFPYDAADMMDLEGFIYRIGNDPTYMPRMPQHVSPQVEELVRSCLQRDAGLRPSAKELTRHPFFF